MVITIVRTNEPKIHNEERIITSVNVKLDGHM